MLGCIHSELLSTFLPQLHGEATHTPILFGMCRNPPTHTKSTDIPKATQARPHGQAQRNIALSPHRTAAHQKPPSLTASPVLLLQDGTGRDAAAPHGTAPHRCALGTRSAPQCCTAPRSLLPLPGVLLPTHPCCSSGPGDASDSDVSMVTCWSGG